MGESAPSIRTNERLNRGEHRRRARRQLQQTVPIARDLVLLERLRYHNASPTRGRIRHLSPSQDRLLSSRKEREWNRSCTGNIRNCIRTTRNVHARSGRGDQPRGPAQGAGDAWRTEAEAGWYPAPRAPRSQTRPSRVGAALRACALLTGTGAKRPADRAALRHRAPPRPSGALLSQRERQSEPGRGDPPGGGAARPTNQYTPSVSHLPRRHVRISFNEALHGSERNAPSDVFGTHKVLDQLDSEVVIGDRVNRRNDFTIDPTDDLMVRSRRNADPGRGELLLLSHREPPSGG